jgi:uncharacterized membrane protein YphA (DoxX/SURF4 family)
MNTASTNSRIAWAGMLARWALGILFIYMGLSKALDPVGFLKLVRQYDLPFSYWLLNSIAAGLPWFETICGLLLLLGVAVRGTALAMLVMLVPFTIVVTQRALDIASLQQLAFCSVRFDCGCGAGVVNVCSKIVENVFLALLSIWLVTGAGRRGAVKYEVHLCRNKSSEPR